ncbi:ankyrin repeat domain-containing protein 27-like [Mytilus californianus]|uniref:ankyrin repeat domain-containing protein 27-like n=1 Tax=Mytilus californianus TaxID=6549 RepID=UPI002248242D|nr:ankyrin repeat domain-containing protein 27-like [Mytilus californianus]
MEMNSVADALDIDIENDERPPSVLQSLIKDPTDDPPFCDIPPLPKLFREKNLADWVRSIDSLWNEREDRIRFCVLMYAFANGGSFSIDMVPKSFKWRDLPKELEEEAWIRSFQYVAKTMDLERSFLYHDQIKTAADKLTEADSEGRGPFFSKPSTEGEKYAFLNEFILDAVTHSYCGKRQYRALALATPVFLYRYCHTRPQIMKIDDYGDRKVSVSVGEHDEDTVYEIFIDEICKGHVYNTLANRMWTDDTFCNKFFKYINRYADELAEEDKERKMFTVVDLKSTKNRPKSFLYCLVTQSPPRQNMLAPVLTFMTKYCTKDFMELQYILILEYCCRKSLIEIYLLFAPRVKTFPFSFIRSAIMGGDSILLDRVLSHQSWNQKQLDKIMQWVAATGKFDDYLRLKQAGAVPDSITLYESVIGKNASIFEDLLRDGIDCDADVYQGRKVIHAAAKIGSTEIVDLLIQRGADVESKSQGGELPLHIAIDNYHEDLAEHLLMRGADANERDHRGATALIRACAIGLYRLVERLMYVGSDTSDTDNQGCNILHKAYLSGEIEVIEFAKSHGFTIDSTDKNNNSVLHFSALSGNLKQFESLLNQMPEKISACNSFMWNPASCAAVCGRWNVFNFLKKNGADVQQIAKDGSSILELSTRGKQLRQQNKAGYIDEFQETIRLGSLEDYNNIIQSLTD